MCSQSHLLHVLISLHIEMNVQALSGYTDPSQNVGKQTEEDFYLLVWF